MRKTILVIEDNALNRELVVQLLEDDYDVVTATDGFSGVATALKRRPDLILMDLSLPLLDGWQATRQLRANGSTQHIPIIALTAHAVPGELQRALDAGCNEWVTKPIEEERLFAAIERWLGTSGRSPGA